MKIAYLGAGTWGLALAALLSKNGHEVTIWGRRKEDILLLQNEGIYPKLKGFKAPPGLKFTADIEEALVDAEMIVESVTSAGLRLVFEKVISIIDVCCPVIITSKGIEQKTGLLLNEVLAQILGRKDLIGCISGPSHAEEVVMGLPTSLVCSAYNPNIMAQIGEAFNTPHFRVYPNSDINGVMFGGAMKNIVAIACGISDGLKYGDNTKAALITRGLHEIRKLSVVKGCRAETLNGLSGLGDLCVTCLSTLSRNYRFGHLIAQGMSVKEAKDIIGMAVEGAYTCVSALELARKNGIPVPICEAANAVLYQNLPPKIAVGALLQRAIKEEHL